MIVRIFYPLPTHEQGHPKNSHALNVSTGRTLCNKDIGGYFMPADCHGRPTCGTCAKRLPQDAIILPPREELGLDNGGIYHWQQAIVFGVRSETGEYFTTVNNRSAQFRPGVSIRTCRYPSREEVDAVVANLANQKHPIICRVVELPALTPDEQRQLELLLRPVRVRRIQQPA